MKDNFSRQAQLYAKYRPVYPQELFDFIFTQTEKKKNAWDCATGNGQAALHLAEFFEQVIATDASAEQIANASPHPKVHGDHSRFSRASWFRAIA